MVVASLYADTCKFRYDDTLFRKLSVLWRKLPNDTFSVLKLAVTQVSSSHMSVSEQRIQNLFFKIGYLPLQ